MSKIFCYFLVIFAPVFYLRAQQVSPQVNNYASREFGQPQLLPSLVTTAPNLVEGRELNQPLSVAFDTNANPPILYIADTSNNRVLAYQNPAALGVCGINNSGCGFASKVIGQRDLMSTLPGGPTRNGGSGLNSGLAFPSAVAVDSSGNLYVADSGNNRILRFPQPFNQSGALPVTDLVIGQKTINSGVSPNEGNQQPSAKTLSLFPSGVLPISLAVDSSGALWVPDPGNNRALRFPASQLAAGTIEPAADIVMGQLDFQTGTERPAPQGTPLGPQFFAGSLRQPTSVAIDAGGNVYISDSYGRVLRYLGPIPSGSVGISATRILGIGISFGQAPLPVVNQYQLSSVSMGLMILGNNLYVADPGNNRIVKYDTPDKWPAPGTLQGTDTNQFSPPMIAVIGQNNLNSGKANKAQPEPDATTFSGPLGAAFLGTDLWVADVNNNRVLSLPQQSGQYVAATRLVGQLDFPFFARNLIEGKEVNFNNSTPAAFSGIAIDKSSNPPHLYVADPYNNRILGFNDARNIQIGQKGDLVIGQTDFYRALINGKTNDPQLPNQVGLNHPTGVVVDSKGNLYVADTGNGRVLRFPAPFNQPSGAQQLPNLVLGQPDFSSQNTDVSIQNMSAPAGLVLFSDGSLGVSDFNHNRVLIFKKSGSDFQNGQNASVILGQPNPNSSAASNTAAGLSNPIGIAVDSSDRLYVSDFSNGRLMVWTGTPSNVSTGASSAAQFLGAIQAPQGIAVSQDTGEIWVSNTANGQIIRLPEFDALILNSTPTTYPTNQIVQTQTAAVAVALDANDNLVTAETSNRVGMYYAALTYQHAANYNQLPIAPGMLTSLYRVGKDFSFPTGSATTNPWPTTMNDFQITVNGQPGAIYGMAGSVLNFQVPTQNVPSSGTVEFLVKRVSTNEIVASGQFQMAQYSPGFFSNPVSAACGQIAAINDDGTINSPSTPVSRDGNHSISFYLTGAGVFDGGPADGFAPTQAANTHDKPTLLSGVFGANAIVPDTDVLYSGAGAFPGGWQINFKVENAFPPGPNNIIALQINGARSNVGVGGQTIRCTFATK
jgi:uncharacterized protein (TIGR03437 family)